MRTAEHEELMMADEPRVYSDEEFAVILRKAAELATHGDKSVSHSDGLTLVEMKSAAAQAGIDPVLVERAARLLATSNNISAFERIIGGSLRHEYSVRLPHVLTEESATRLLSAIRLGTAHLHSVSDGHASALGVTWQASSEGDVLSVAARPQNQEVAVSVNRDRRGTFVLAAGVSGFAVFASFLAGIGLNDFSPVLAPWIPVAGTVGTLAALRGFWAKSTRRAREQVETLMEAIGESVKEGK